MEAIKHSRIIVVLLILYIGISIIVVTLDNSQKKNKKSSSETSQKTDDSVKEFITEISTINSNVISYYSDREIQTEICIPLSYVMGDDYSGSAYVSGQSVVMWHSNGTHAINGVETNLSDVSSEDVEDEYTTDYYNSCGLNE